MEEKFENYKKQLWDCTCEIAAINFNIQKIETALDVLETFKFGEDVINEMWMLLNKQKILLTEAQKAERTLNKEMEDAQKECAHEFKEKWHDSHHTYYECIKCGYQERD